MMRVNVAIMSVAVTVAALAQIDSRCQSHPRFYLLNDPVQHQWCIYQDESTWKKDVQDTRAMVVASVVEDDDLTTIDVTEDDESGDWMVFDTYSFDGAGAPKSLKRVTNSLPEDLSDERVYAISDGTMALRSEVTRRLRTGQQVPSRDDWLPDVPIVARISDFPFAPLMNAQWFKTVSPKICLGTGQ